MCIRDRSVAEACSYVMQTAGHLDILVNNAAVGRSDKPLVEESLEEWNAILGTNLTGTFLMMKHVGKIMIGQKAGKAVSYTHLDVYKRQPLFLRLTHLLQKLAFYFIQPVTEIHIHLVGVDQTPGFIPQGIQLPLAIGADVHDLRGFVDTPAVFEYLGHHLAHYIGSAL